MVDQKVPEIKRQTAYKCNIASIITGIFVKKEGWESNYMITNYGDFSRVNIIAVIVEKEANSIILDDGTGRIHARMFEHTTLLEGLQISDIVLIIGRPREFNNQIYLALEIVRKINHPGWIVYRKKELQLIKKVRDVSELKTTTPPEAETVESAGTSNNKDKILQLIKELDNGQGAAIDDVIKFSKIHASEELITDLLLKGEIFEIKAGRVKLME
ncbi:MAG: hypothetical protein WC916_01660 [Candidatus Woesearchaeota archaeon]